TGFAPLKSMLRHILEKGPSREVHLYWGARQPQDLYEEAQVLAWQQRHPGLKFTAVLSEASDPGAPHRRLGWVHEQVLRDYPSLAGVDVYTAGPPALIEAIRASFPQHGLSADRLHFDSFDYAPPAANAAPADNAPPDPAVKS
ncbi:MAG TPA: hypothetical protein VL176_11205, partial [Steroidobacteraceae bacterium]|nr:hypothetical protein [Steroidobacteraceae bacterium]